VEAAQIFYAVEEIGDFGWLGLASGGTKRMITVLTLCSANYLAQAESLGDSVSEHNPDYHFVIGLVDRLPKEVDAQYWHPYELNPVEELAIPCFEEMERKYNLVELNTAVKPFYMEYLYRRDSAVSGVIYLDPDIQVFARFNKVEEKLFNLQHDRHSSQLYVRRQTHEHVL
jgi:hypothetical protein